LIFLVGTLLAITGFFLLHHKKLKDPPYPLIAVACLAEAMLYILNAHHSHICTEWQVYLLLWSYKPLGKLIGISVETDVESLYHTMSKILDIWRDLYIISMFAVIVTNSFIYLDLYQIVRNPFSSRFSRARRHGLYIIIVMVLCTVFTIY